MAHPVNSIFSTGSVNFWELILFNWPWSDCHCNCCSCCVPGQFRVLRYSIKTARFHRNRISANKEQHVFCWCWRIHGNCNWWGLLHIRVITFKLEQFLSGLSIQWGGWFINQKMTVTLINGTRRRERKRSSVSFNSTSGLYSYAEVTSLELRAKEGLQLLLS